MSRALPEALRVHAPAKINLSLRVFGRDPRGYHDIRTVFQSIDVRDTLVVARARGAFTLRCSDPACPADETNLVWQAAQRLWAWSGRKGRVADVSVSLTKRIPERAGLGGGSSDAAAALRALAVMWRLDVPREALVGLAAGLGADVPFFLSGGTALGVDRGDTIFPLPDLPVYEVVVALPSFGVSTADAYRWFDDAAPAVRPARRRPPAPSLGIPPGELGNDLEGPVVARHPAIGRLIGGLRRGGATYAAMSGSGSAVFGLFERAGAARAAAAALSGRGVRSVVARTLTSRRARALSQVRPWRGGS